MPVIWIINWRFYTGTLRRSNVKTTSNRIDFGFPDLIEQIEDRGDYVAIKTPGLPGFYFGNYLLFPNPPGSED